MHLRIFEDVLIHRRAHARDFAHGGFEFDDFNVLHLRHLSEPASGAASPEADDERAFRIRMQNRADETGHDLRAGVEPAVAVDFSIDDERDACIAAHAHAALDALGLPKNRASEKAPEVFERIHGRRAHLRAPRADAAVTPRGSRAGREKHERGGKGRDDRGERETFLS